MSAGVLQNSFRIALIPASTMPQKFTTWDVDGVIDLYTKLEKLMDRPSPDDKVTIANHQRVINSVIEEEIVKYQAQFMNK